MIRALRARAAATLVRRPLSHNQRALWFIAQEAPDSAAYNVALSVRLKLIFSAFTLGGHRPDIRRQSVAADLEGRMTSAEATAIGIAVTRALEIVMTDFPATRLKIMSAAYLASHAK